MLLQRLTEFGQRHGEGDVPVGYKPEPVGYWIELDRDGRLLGIVPAETEDGKRAKAVPVPALVRSVAIRPKLLADNGAYVLGIARETDKPERVREMHRAFVNLVARAADETGETTVAAVSHFLAHSDTAGAVLPPNFNPAMQVSFLVDGCRPIDLPAVREFWTRYTTPGKRMECLVCGRSRPVMDRLQAKLKGIPGGQASGLALISANAPAFASYGLEASTVAPTCYACSDAFMKGANALISDPNTHLRIGNAVYIFWTRGDVAFDALALLSHPDPDDVRSLLSQVYRGGAADLDAAPFYGACLSASGSRAVVRDWIDTTLGEAQRRLARFFDLQAVTGDWGNEPRPLGVYSLGAATLRSGTRDSPPPWTVQALVHCALLGGPLPFTLLLRAVERCRAENGVSPWRAALIKLVLRSRSEESWTGGTDMAELDMENRDPAYLCGRLLAELEATQRAALGEVGATIVDRYYGTASSAPATVFGRLVRGAQPHLARLRRDRHGAYTAIQSRLEEILADLTLFPPTLTLEQQGVFALGYYHQRAADRQAARSRATRARADGDQTSTTESESE